MNLNAWHGRLKIRADLFMDGGEVWSFGILETVEGHDQSLLRHFQEQPIGGIHVEVDEQRILVRSMRQYCPAARAVSVLSAPSGWTY